MVGAYGVSNSKSSDATILKFKNTHFFCTLASEYKKDILEDTILMHDYTSVWAFLYFKTDRQSFVNKNWTNF